MADHRRELQQCKHAEERTNMACERKIREVEHALNEAQALNQRLEGQAEREAAQLRSEIELLSHQLRESGKSREEAYQRAKKDKHELEQQVCDVCLGYESAPDADLSIENRARSVS